jgi:hypothetical protein
MQTFTQALIEHVLSGKVDREVAANAATNRHDFLVALDQATKRKKAADNVVAAEIQAAADVIAEAEAKGQVVQDDGEGGLGLRIVPVG